ncbi:FIST N-terminal domain-containing protein [Actinoplanes sp. NPDC049265]|uniref:FIST N-terminal domain-containing protein n=1 Tax=Actinoplanes sp. NPDC049265 TaxID=3363902 RepID=UPI00371BD389
MATTSELRKAARVTMASAASHQADGAAAVGELAERLGDQADLYAVFVAPGYDLDVVGRRLRHHFGDRVIGCTSSGNVGAHGYDRNGICAVALTGGGITTRTVVVNPLSDPVAAVENAGARLAAVRAELGDRDKFAILLADGLTGSEDELAATLMAMLGDVPIIGGSAGDGLQFRRTAVYHDGVFGDDRATVTLVAAEAPFRLLRLQHHLATDTVLVATDVDPGERIVRTLNGQTAVEAYAEAVGVGRDQMTPVVFSQHPLLLAAGGASWVRSIAEVRDDGALRMFARVDLGDVLRLGRSTGMVERLQEGIAEVRDDLGSLSGMLVFDCILRRLESEEHGLSERVGQVLAACGAAGFSTYGEQFNGMHMNQTLVAVAFG